MVEVYSFQFRDSLTDVFEVIQHQHNFPLGSVTNNGPDHLVYPLFEKIEKFFEVIIGGNILKKKMEV